MAGCVHPGPGDRRGRPANRLAAIVSSQSRALTLYAPWLSMAGSFSQHRDDNTTMNMCVTMDTRRSCQRGRNYCPVLHVVEMAGV